jgi:hypothetical protein
MKWKLIVVILILLILANAVVIYYRSVSINDQRITCRNMMYACGDCHPQYKIIGSETKESEKLLGEEITVEFKNPDQQWEFDQAISMCVICFEFEFSGDLRYSFWDKEYTMVVSDYDLLLDGSCCDAPYNQGQVLLE